MRSLSCKAVIPVAVAVTGFVVVCCFLLYSLIRSDMSDLEVRHAKDLTMTIVKSTRQAMLNDDREMLANIIKNVGEHENVEHVRIYNKSGKIVFSQSPEETGRILDISSGGCMECHSGSPGSSWGIKTRHIVNEDKKDVFAISAPIQNEQQCSGMTCHPSLDTQKLLGVLEVHLSRQSVATTLGLLRNRMLLFSLMVLFLTVGGVAALLNRVVFIPLKRLVDFTQERVDGNIETDFPSTDCELEKVADGVTLLAARLAEARQTIAKAEEKLVMDAVPSPRETVDIDNFVGMIPSQVADTDSADVNDAISSQNFDSAGQRLYPSGQGEDT